MNLRTEIIDSVHQIPAADWDALWNPKDAARPYPFTRHGFLAALEDSGSTNAESGWQSQHLLVYNADLLLAAMPIYQKTHSYGEYVFDWAWADAYARNGLNYYPKLVNGIPFTPTTGPRFAMAAHLDENQQQEVFQTALQALKNKLNCLNGSSFHCLFPDKYTQKLAKQEDLLQRQGVQFHWFNQNYQSFDDFLSTFNSRKRKALKKERAKAQRSDLDIAIRPAEQISKEEWKIFNQLYHRTYLKRSGRYGYLGEDFFERLAAELPTQVLLATVYQQDIFVAGALYLRDETTLYGRYWGTREDIDGLHFETCYYQGIDYAIREGLQRFDPGAQGEHKIQRGFVPVKTCSFHWLAHPSFHDAVADFVLEEQKHNAATVLHAREFLPFKEGVDCPEINCLLI